MLSGLQGESSYKVDNAPPTNQSSVNLANEVTAQEPLQYANGSTWEAELEENTIAQLFDSPVYESPWELTDEKLAAYEDPDAPNKEAPHYSHDYSYFDGKKMVYQCFCDAGRSCPKIREDPLVGTMIPLAEIFKGRALYEATTSADVHASVPLQGTMVPLARLVYQGQGSRGLYNEATTSPDMRQSPPVRK